MEINIRGIRMNDKLEFLNQYELSNRKISILSDSDIINNTEIPEYWRQAFMLTSFLDRKSVIVNEWKKFLGSELSNTISYLEEFLEDLDVIKTGDSYSLLYSIKTYQTNNIVYYEGKMPIPNDKFLGKFKDTHVEIDKSIIDFYTKIHDGFNYYTSKSMGLDSLDMIESMADYDWDFEEDLSENIMNWYNFFSNGMGQYIVLNLSQPMKYAGVFWSKDELPRYPINFWDYIDEWIVIGLDF